MKQITTHFYRREFACKCGCGYDNIDHNVVHRLQVLRDIVDSPICITSGCRCYEHNKSIKGAEDSFHCIGSAIDFTTLTHHMEHLNDIFNPTFSGGWHYYPDKQIIHMDIGPKRRW